MRCVDNWPVRGVRFYDLNPLISSDLFDECVGALAQKVKFLMRGPVKLCVIESRGFIWGSAVAGYLGLSVIPIRKLGKIPPVTVHGYTHIKTEYSQDDLVLPTGCVNKGDSVIVIDDVMASGQTALGAINLLTWAGARVIASLSVLRLKKLNGKKVIHPVISEALLDI